jgi:multiple sugar transport system substrate-binding protein
VKRHTKQQGHPDTTTSPGAGGAAFAASGTPVEGRGRKFVTGVALSVATVLALAGCSGAAGSTEIDAAAPAKLEGTVSLWHFFTGREATVIQGVVDDFETANPGVTVEVNEGQDDDKLQKVISSGGNIDVGLSYSTAIVGNFCSSGAFRDLGPYIERDGVDLSDIPTSVQEYTEYDGTRCTMPMLSDTDALVYNQAIFDEAGIAGPPKTLSELTDVALKLTEYNDDGSIKRLGFNPLIDFYENSASHFGPAVGGSWLTEDGKSAIGGDAGWATVMKWQKDLVDAIGYDKLKAFTAGLGQEFAADNAFHTGQVAMEIDGEYRTAFIADQVPDLDYSTAPFPTADDNTDSYGAGYIAGNVAGIAKGSKNPELAWALLKYMITDTAAVVKMANGLKNVPTLTSALQSPDLEVSPQYKTFVDIASHPKTSTMPASADGAAYATTFTNYWVKYQAGDGGDLDAGLAQVDTEVNAGLDLVSGP